MTICWVGLSHRVRATKRASTRSCGAITRLIVRRASNFLGVLLKRSPKSVRMTLACIRKSSLNFQVFDDAVDGSLGGGRVKFGSSNVGRSRFVHCQLL